MRTVGARLQNVAPGKVEIDLPFREDLTQHHGYVAPAVLTAIVDVACGYAAMTLMPRIGVDDRVQGELSFAGAGRANGSSWEGCQARAMLLRFRRQRKDRGDDVVDDGDGRPDA